MSRALRGACLVACLLAGAPAAAEVPEPAPPDPIQALRELLGAQELAAIGSHPDAVGLLVALESRQMVRARELAESILDDDPEAIEGHCGLGLVMVRAEGNLAGGAFHLEHCVEAFAARHGTPGDGEPWLWHRLALGTLANVSGDMGRRDEAIAWVDELQAQYGEDRRYWIGWWLLRAGRLKEARELAVSVIAEGTTADDRVYGWNVLCAVEGEEGKLEAMYAACKASVEEDRGDTRIDPVQLTNAAEAARAMLKPGEAEALLLEATNHFHPQAVAVPWSELLWLHVIQARLPEAADAMRQSQRWRRRQRAWIGALTWALQDVNTAHFLLVAGHPSEAAQLTRRALEGVDRDGRRSTDGGEEEGWASLLDAAVHRTLAEACDERASWSRWREALEARWCSASHRLRAWRAGRRFVANFSNRRMLESRFVPHAAGRVPIPEWLELDLVELLGPAVVEGELERIDLRPPPEGAAAYALAFAAEAAHRAGDHAAALDRALLALESLPGWEALLRARVLASAADSAAELGDSARAASLFDRVWQIDPGAIRRGGHALPTRFTGGDSEAAREALRNLEGSPRFRRANAGFEIQVQGDAAVLMACLRGPHGSVLRCVEARPGRNGETAAAVVAERLHAEVFAPRVNLSQMDLRSLDGSTVVSGGGDPQVRSVLDELLAGEEEPAE